MTEKVAIVGVGYTKFRSTIPDLSYRELTYEAATKAYEEAGVEPKDIDSFVSTAEDFFEGYAIADEYCPDQLGAVLKPVNTIAGDFLQSLITAYMMILTGRLDIVAVQAMSKASNMTTLGDLELFAFDPVFNRPLAENPHFVAGLEMNRYLYESKTTRKQCAKVVVKNKRNALINPYAGHGVKIAVEDVLNSEIVSYPLTHLDISPNSDGAVVMVLASKETAKKLTNKPVWIRGVGWCSDTFSLENRDWGQATSTKIAAEMAYKMAKIDDPKREIDLVELSDLFSYKELQHLESLKFCNKGEAGKMVDDGVTEIGGELPVNPSGGSLGVGHLYECSGAQKTLEVVLQLRGEAGKRQIKNANIGLAHAWRGVPTTTCAIAILSN